MNKLEGKVAVITGGSSGIGLATAKRFVADGAYVFITGRHQIELDKAVNDIGKNVTSVRGDVSNIEDLDRLYSIVKKQQGDLDVLFANAGIGEFAKLEELSEEHFDKTFGVNVKGLLFSVQKSIPLFKNGGSIILNSSIAASKGVEGFSVYSATKAAVRSFARTWAVDLRHRNIRVNAISPGLIDTQALSNLMQNEKQSDRLKNDLVRTVPMRRMGTPDEVAKVVLFLASNDSSYITGIDLAIDGGEAQI